MKRKRPEQTTPQIRYNAYARDYEKALVAFVRAMAKSAGYHITAALKRQGIITEDAATAPTDFRLTLQELFRRYDKQAGEFAEKITQKQLERLTRYVQSRYSPLLGKDAKRITRRVQEVIKARYLENFALITSIPAWYKLHCENILYGAITGGDKDEIMERLRQAGAVTERRARTIARDQTAKAAEALNAARAAELGIEYYRWLTCQDERVSEGRGGHRQLDGKIFRYDEPEAIIDAAGHKGHPAERVNCRCTSIGIFLKPGERIVRAADGYGYEVKTI